MMESNNEKVVEITPELEARVRRYNNELKECKEDSADIKARVEYGQKNLKQSCENLSSLLGIEVTEDNLQEIYDKELAKILNDLEIGEKILERIRNKEIDDSEVEDKDKVIQEVANSKNNIAIDRTYKVDEGIVNEKAIEKEESMLREEPVSNSREEEINSSSPRMLDI